MNESMNTIESLSVENQMFYDRTLLERELPELEFYEDADKKTIPKGKGTNIEFRKFNSLKVPENSLTEGVTPTGNKLDITKLTATCKQEGDFVTVTDVLDMQGKDPVITESSELFGEQSALVVDTRIRDEVTSGTTVQYANGKATRDSITVTDVLTGDEILKAHARLKNNNIKPFSDGTYHAIISPYQEYDFKKDTSGNGFVEINKYTNNTPLLKGEIGNYFGSRIRSSSNIETVKNTSNVTIHKSVIYGRHAYGVPNIEKGGAKAKIIVKPLGSSGTADPLNQRSTVGWKAFFTAKRLNELAICRIETAATLDGTVTE
ncbi:MAG: N4-gp56 family major capsid protein [Bacilli bacterium]|nr:N4-gp56 family major capsid protein [Bacilli bacterium]